MKIIHAVFFFLFLWAQVKKRRVAVSPSSSIYSERKKEEEKNKKTKNEIICKRDFLALNIVHLNCIYIYIKSSTNQKIVVGKGFE